MTLLKQKTNFEHLSSDVNEMSKFIKCPFIKDKDTNNFKHSVAKENSNECPFALHDKQISCEECKKEWLMKPFEQK